MKKDIWLVILALSVVAFAFSILVFLEHQGNSAVQGICSSLDVTNGCKTVAESLYASLFGFDNSIVGVLGFAVMIALSVLAYLKNNLLAKKLVILGSVIAGFFAISFIYIQAFLIQAYCLYCLVVDFCSIALIVLALVQFFSNKKIFF